MTLGTGHTLDGRYEILAPLDSGGMGEVYRARHLLSKKIVAIKVLYSHVATDERSLERFRREISVAAEVGHDGIVDVLDAGMDRRDQTVFVVMELLEGENLRTFLDRPGRDESTALDIIDGMLEPLAAAHAKGFVHRDLKPENVFIARRRDGSLQAKLLDFGIARQLNDASAGSKTQTGVALGTPYYMAPEQAVSAKGAVPAADVWSTGVMLYEIVGGVPPFEGETPHAIVIKACTQPHRDLRLLEPGVDPELASLIDLCLAKDPERRPRDATVLRLMLKEARGGVGLAPTEAMPVMDGRTPPPGRFGPPSSRSLGTPAPTGDAAVAAVAPHRTPASAPAQRRDPGTAAESAASGLARPRSSSPATPSSSATPSSPATPPFGTASVSPPGHRPAAATPQPAFPASLSGAGTPIASGSAVTVAATDVHVFGGERPRDHGPEPTEDSRPFGQSGRARTPEVPTTRGSFDGAAGPMGPAARGGFGSTTPDASAPLAVPTPIGSPPADQPPGIGAPSLGHPLTGDQPSFARKKSAQSSGTGRGLMVAGLVIVGVVVLGCLGMGVLFGLGSIGASSRQARGPDGIPALPFGFRRVGAQGVGFAVPDSWIEVPPPVVGVASAFRDPTATNGFFANATLVIESYPADPATYPQAAAISIGQASVLERQQPLVLFGRPAAELEAITADANMRSIYRVVAFDGRGYAIGCHGPLVGFELVRSRCNDVVASFSPDLSP